MSAYDEKEPKVDKFSVIESVAVKFIAGYVFDTMRSRALTRPVGRRLRCGGSSAGEVSPVTRPL